MRLNGFLAAATSLLSVALLLTALFVPWQTLTAMGATTEPGLQEMRFQGFGQDQSASWEQVDDEGDTQAFSLAFGLTVAATVAAFATTGASLAMVPVPRMRWATLGVAVLGVALTVTAIMAFMRGVEDFFGSEAAAEFDATTGLFLAIGGAIGLGLATALALLPSLDRPAATPVTSE